METQNKRQEKLESVSADKGYYSKKNILALEQKVKESGIQVPGKVKNRPNVDNLQKRYIATATIYWTPFQERRE